MEYYICSGLFLTILITLYPKLNSKDYKQGTSNNEITADTNPIRAMKKIVVMDIRDDAQWQYQTKVLQFGNKNDDSDSLLDIGPSYKTSYRSVHEYVKLKMGRPSKYKDSEVKRVRSRFNDKVCVEICEKCQTLISLEWSALCYMQCWYGGHAYEACVTMVLRQNPSQ